MRERGGKEGEKREEREGEEEWRTKKGKYRRRGEGREGR